MQGGATTGKLRVEVVEARLQRDTETFSKMDPWCRLKYREQQVKTKTLDGAGKTPKWNQTFDFDIKYIGDDFQIECLDEDPCKSDLIGECNVKCSAFCANGGIDEWYELQFKGKRAGLLHIKTKWMPDGAAPQQQQHMQQQMPNTMQVPQQQRQQFVQGAFQAMGGQQMPPQQMYPQQQQMGMPQQQMGMPQQQMGMPPQGYPQQQMQQPGYPQQQQMGMPPQGYPQQQMGMPPQGYPQQQMQQPGYPPQQQMGQPGQYPPQQQMGQPGQYPPQQQMGQYPPQNPQGYAMPPQGGYQ